MLRQAAEKEGIIVSEADVDRELKKIAEQAKVTLDQVRSYYQSHDEEMKRLKYQFKEEKTIELLLSQVTV